MPREPKPIGEGATLSLVAPSFGCTTEPYRTRLEESIRILSSLGYRIEEGRNIRLNAGVASSNTPASRAKEFEEAYFGKGDAILSVGGGELMCEILPFVDFKAIRIAKPKWFVGFSDNTNLTFTLTTLADLVTVYGPCAGQFFSYPFRYATEDTFRLLKGERRFQGYPLWERESRASEENPLAEWNLTEEKVIRPFGYEEPFSGTLLGGCLDCLVTLCGTRFDNVVNFSKGQEGIVWFLEACDLNPLAIRRALFQLREAGWFANAKGFLIGRPLCHDADALGVNKYNAVLDILEPLNKPILMDVDLGHFPPSMPMKCGALARASFVNGNLEIEYL